MYKRHAALPSWHGSSGSTSGGEVVFTRESQTESSSSVDVPMEENDDAMGIVPSEADLLRLELSAKDDTFFLKSLDALREELANLCHAERVAIDSGVRSRKRCLPRGPGRMEGKVPRADSSIPRTESTDSRTDYAPIGGAQEEPRVEPDCGPIGITDDKDAVSPECTMHEGLGEPATRYEDVQWALGLLLVPSLRNLPRDTSDLAIIPHSHPMIPQKAGDGSYGYLPRFATWGYKTEKVCDNCQRDIHEQSWFHCSRDCDIDFCQLCEASLRRALDHCCTLSGCNDSHEIVAEKCRDYVRVVEDAVFCLMHSTRSVRGEISHVLQGVRMESFTSIVVCVRDYLNAKVVHLEDVKDIGNDVTFWYMMAFMQMLQQINAKRRRDCTETFTLMGINKCEPLSELCRWKKNLHQRGAPSIEHVEDMKFEVESSDFCCFLTHRNLLPAALLRTVAFYDAWGVLLQPKQDENRMVGDNREFNVRRTEIEVSRMPEETVLTECINIFSTQDLENIRCPLVIRFKDEVAEGPGVNREYLQLALATLVQSNMFEYMEDTRCYFFRREKKDSTPCSPKLFLAFGRLLAHVVLNKAWLQPAFPTIFFGKLCLGLKNASPRYRINDLREFDPATAASLDAVQNHKGDVTDLCIEGLHDGNRREYVRNFLVERLELDVSTASTAMAEGFKSILGDSDVLQALMPEQLKRILCGGEEECIDILALKQSARCDGFDGQDAYLDEFWSLLDEWDEPTKRKFIRFVTAGDRAPLKGWGDLQLSIHKNGAEPTDRLPTAYTCYNMMLLPHYADRAKLENRLLAAIHWAEGFGLQ
eukprot:GEMP01005191.1.p1 GENE.GEMP01005191.1~~GEMP01005191.1.p1  ORF type:complete len:816 (+),score=165.72 GEMP01005191.1:212-2659(+)